MLAVVTMIRKLQIFLSLGKSDTLLILLFAYLCHSIKQYGAYLTEVG